ncbi:Trk system potassium uptake protein TrkA [Caenispirillum salinarum AK4]|uniref:Trk system potassium uptake protein TrkA n=1 Tax=Caenispirillum salinarum AK4 TaxID=1238182 RepID=K9H2J5_9PROT|nr:NAD-binding protein [Caenispirillum salinarum]EKV31802.1 Trk system potassium uptake protein TrkA [Caenispirillum salinarum AK4]
MRLVCIGAGPLTLNIVRMLVDKGHDIVIIEQDRARIEDLTEDLDVGFLHGDGAKPMIQREAKPAESDALLCLTDDDEDNILAALVGRQLGFPRVIPKIQDADFLGICEELGLENTIIPDQTMARHVVDLVVAGADADLSAFIGGGVRFYSFEVTEDEAGPCTDLDLPEKTRPVLIQRGEDFELAEEASEVQAGDRVLLVTHVDHLSELRDRWPARHVREGEQQDGRQGRDKSKRNGAD